VLDTSAGRQSSGPSSEVATTWVGLGPRPGSPVESPVRIIDGNGVAVVGGLGEVDGNAPGPGQQHGAACGGDRVQNGGAAFHDPSVDRRSSRRRRSSRHPTRDGAHPERVAEVEQTRCGPIELRGTPDLRVRGPYNRRTTRRAPTSAYQRRREVGVIDAQGHLSRTDADQSPPTHTMTSSLITRRSWVQIPPPPPSLESRSYALRDFAFSGDGINPRRSPRRG
jgi:hypothetical protein